MEDALGRALLTLLDGTRNRESLMNDLHGMVLNRGSPRLKSKTKTQQLLTNLREIIDGNLEQSLSWLSMARGFEFLG